MAYTTLDLLQSIKDRAMIPDASTGVYGSASLLARATEELHSLFVPMILSAREKYYEVYEDFAIVANQAAYPIPTRAIGGIASCVQLIQSPRIDELGVISPTQVTTDQTALAPSGYYMENFNVILYPTPNSSQGTIRIRYFQRPSRLEQTVNCAQVASFDPVAMTVTVSSIPSTWTAGTTLDFIPAIIPFTPYGLDSVASGVVGTTITFSTLPTTLQVGDWIALAGYTPIPEVPFEMMGVLAQAAAAKTLEASGDAQNAGIANQKLDAAMKAALQMITPRVTYTAKKFNSGWNRW